MHKKLNCVFVIVVILPVLAIQTSAQIQTRLDSMTFIGHASVKIVTSQGAVIYIDPYGESYDPFSDSADILLVTHSHSDHNLQYLVTKKTDCVTITYSDAVKNGIYGEYMIGDVKVTAVPAYNGFHSKSSCVGYVIEFNNIRLYHAGDTGFITEMNMLAAQNITYALLPIDGVYTMSPEGAVAAANAVNAAYNIPIHTMPPPDTYDTVKAGRFTAPNKVIVKHGETIALHSNALNVSPTNSSPHRFELHQNYPNPFNSRTTIRFTVPAPSRVTLKIFDLLGREVHTLLSDVVPAGNHSRQWDAALLNSGIYYYRLHTESLIDTKKMIYLK